MISKIKIGDIFNSRAQTLVNTVNCIGVMGKGIAAEFKKRFPDMFKDYKERCDRKELHLGKPYLHKTLVAPWVLNFPTKDHWRSVSKLLDIERGIDYLVANYKIWGITSLAVPPLGCGSGQLEWNTVGPLLYRKFCSIDIPVELYAPFGMPKKYLTESFLSTGLRTNKVEKYFPVGESRLNPAWLVLVEILYRIEQNPYHYSIGRTIFQKIGYVITEQGIPTNFKYNQSSYGPFSYELKRAVTILANNNLIIEENIGSLFKIKTGPAYKEYQKSMKNEIEKYYPIINRTVDLFMRMNSRQAELATTIYYSYKEIKQNKKVNEVSEKIVFDYVMDWKKRRRPPLKESNVALAIRNLAMLGWIKVKYSDDLPLLNEF